MARKESLYFGTAEPLPKLTKLRVGNLTCVYENGGLRYIRHGNHEVIRRIYISVRDRHWLTVPGQITDEKITVWKNGFSITYHCLYAQGNIRYRTQVQIEGTADNSICFSVRGQSLGQFMRNRIGICVLHPILECAGKKCTVTQPDGNTYEAFFPETISPHQPFTNVRQMRWQTGKYAEAELTLEGEVFETEDQRNWTDASFKTYGTPLSLPFPVEVKKDEIMFQKLTLTLSGTEEYRESTEDSPIGFNFSAVKYPLPSIGYSRSSSRESLTEKELVRLRNIVLQHYRVEIKFEANWRADFENACQEAERINTVLEIVIFLDDLYETQFPAFMKTLTEKKDLLRSILILHKNHPATPRKLLENILPKLRQQFPGLKIGAGTDANFAELNRNRPVCEAVDFISYPVNPQVHYADVRSLIENLAAQRHTLQTARTFAGSKKIHVSPITLKPRLYPETTDEPTGKLPPDADSRQPSLFVAAWTLLSIKYLCNADLLTFYETVGEKGLLNGHVFAVYLIMQELSAFGATHVHDVQGSHPLQLDAVVFENRMGEQMAVIINFTEELQKIKLPVANFNTIQTKKLTAKNATPFLKNPGFFLDQWRQENPAQSEFVFLLPGESIGFVKYSGLK